MINANNNTLTAPEELFAAGLIADSDVSSLKTVAERYATAISPSMLDAMRQTKDSHVIARQFVPTAAELNTSPEEMKDPIGDEAHSPVKGVVHRYPDRVLLMPTLTCPVYCRFCFRREVVGTNGGTLTKAQLDHALDYIRATPNIWEVILTGGDPLILSPRRLANLISALEEIPHIKVIRIHTRVPIATPDRLSAELIAALKNTSKPVYVAIHCNHAAELTRAAQSACAALVNAGIPLLSQTVLLKGVNDSVEALETLMRTLVTLRVKPYYLHQLDFAPGTSHFRVPIEEGQSLVRRLRGRLSGLAQPTYMLDIPGGAGKVPLTPSYMKEKADRSASVESPKGEIHTYTPPTHP